MKERLDEIIITAKKALALAEKEPINTKPIEVDKGFISMGGAFDSIILIAQDIIDNNDCREHSDNVDHADHHNIAGGMNRPARDATYEKEEKW